MKRVVGILEEKAGKKMSVIASPNFAVEPSWGGRICAF
jgi:hypothetical protein